MKEKLFISLLAYVICVTATYSQAHIILPDSSQITTNRDSLDLLPRHVPDRLQPDFQDSISPQPASHIHHFHNDHGIPADSLQPQPQMILWKLDTRTGDRLPAPSDTLLYNYQHTILPDGQSVAMGFLAPLGSPAFSKIFADRPETEQFIFNNAYSLYLKNPEKVLFVNTRVPYSRLSYDL